MSIFWGELIGTMVMVLLGNGVAANVWLARSRGHNGGWIVIAAGWGLAVGVAVYITGWASGGAFNPAITLGLSIAKLCAWETVPLYLAGQFIGAFIGAVLVWLVYFPHWQKTADPQHKLLCYCTQPAIRNYGWNFVCEMVATMVLLIGILHSRSGLNSAIAPYAAPFFVFAIGLSLGGPTGFAINPARDLAPRIAYAILPIRGKGSPDWAYAWVPCLAPLAGSMMGAVIYLLYIAPLG